MPWTGSDLRRKLLGILALALLAVSLYGWLVYGVTDSDAQANLFFSTCQRLGLLFGAVWLAYPQLARLAASTSAASARFLLLMAVIGLIILIRPKSIVVLGPVMLILAGLQFAGWLLRK